MATAGEQDPQRPLKRLRRSRKAESLEPEIHAPLSGGSSGSRCKGKAADSTQAAPKKVGLPAGYVTDAWKKQAAALTEWVNDHSSLPNLKSADEKEAQLARFLAAQRQALSRRNLNDEKLRLLCEKTPLVRALLDAYAAALAKRPQLQTFEQQVANLKAWATQHKSLPWRRNASEEERRLQNFLLEQTKKFKQGQLSEPAEKLLLEVPGMMARVEKWKSDCGQAKQVPFHKRLEELQAWVEANKRLPRQKVPDEEEAFFGRFLNKVCKGKLSEERRARLAQVPGLAERLERKSAGYVAPFEDRVKALRAWVDAHQGQLPKRTSGDSEELKMARFIGWHRYRFHTGELSATERRMLAEQVPGMSEAMEKWEESAEQEVDEDQGRTSPWSIMTMSKMSTAAPSEAGGGFDSSEGEDVF
eukprot:TRINITY_DN21241_c0_g1_i1.p1 TRINITY_DN21241_c0_g1~~TRINITY_DN21241_c0_g1_i1.p1  ORF type:complete len:416 (-),score=118.35 TRINITY_DN21241_c0_g1_i1:141-1388(-)